MQNRFLLLDAKCLRLLKMCFASCRAKGGRPHAHSAATVFYGGNNPVNRSGYGMVVLLFFASYSGVAQEKRSDSDAQLRTVSASGTVNNSQIAVDQDVQLLRKDVRSQKKQIVAANLELSDAEAVKFWPVYDRYTADLSKIYDTKLALVEEYMDHYTTMTGELAENYIRRRAAVEQDVMQLRLKYVPEFRRVLSGRETALFFQIEWRLDLMVNLQLAQAPLIDP